MHCLIKKEKLTYALGSWGGGEMKLHEYRFDAIAWYCLLHFLVLIGKVLMWITTIYILHYVDLCWYDEVICCSYYVTVMLSQFKIPRCIFETFSKFQVQIGHVRTCPDLETTVMNIESLSSCYSKYHNKHYYVFGISQQPSLCE